MKYDVKIVIENLLDLKIGEVNIPKSELENLQDACQCDLAYEIYDMIN